MVPLPTTAARLNSIRNTPPLTPSAALPKKAKGDLDGAIADHKRAIELDPKLAKNHVRASLLVTLVMLMVPLAFLALPRLWSAITSRRRNDHDRTAG